jgi:hypothetical protein
LSDDDKERLDEITALFGAGKDENTDASQVRRLKPERQARA